MDRYHAKYTDAYGSEDITITNDGESLRTTIRGLQFVGTDFDSLEPFRDATPEQLQSFALHDGFMCACRIECQMPLPIQDHGNQSHGTLFVELLLGDPASNGALDREELAIVLDYNDQRFAGSGKSGWFEDELIEIQRQLPDGVFMRACINCLYSDYSPYGHGLFGYMMCFRNIKEEYRRVTTKIEFWSVHDRYEPPGAGNVFVPGIRTQGSGNRLSWITGVICSAGSRITGPTGPPTQSRQVIHLKRNDRGR